MQALRNLLIIMALAFVVAVVPGGGNAAATILLALQIAFLAAIAWALFRFYESSSAQMTLDTIADGRRVILFGSVGAIALLIAGYEQFASWSGGVVVWLLLMFTALAAIFVVWRDATTYS